jgi:hypothetical protein
MMEILFTSYARAGGIEIPPGKRIFSAPTAKTPATDRPRRPGRVKAGLALLLRHLGKTVTSLGERLVAPSHNGSLETGSCR